MRRQFSILATALFCCAIGSASLADEAVKAGKAAKAPSQEEMMAQWAKMAAPGEHHAMLKPLAGSWKTVVKTWLAPGEPKVTEGTCESTWILGDRYLKEECTGTFDGQPFQGMGITGYDNMKKKYISTWTDTMGTGFMISDGLMDKATKTLKLNGKSPDPASGKMMNVRMSTKIVNDDTHVFTMSGLQGGKETTMMEITYTRK